MRRIQVAALRELRALATPHELPDTIFTARKVYEIEGQGVAIYGGMLLARQSDWVIEDSLERYRFVVASPSFEATFQRAASGDGRSDAYRISSWFSILPVGDDFELVLQRGTLRGSANDALVISPDVEDSFVIPWVGKADFASLAPHDEAPTRIFISYAKGDLASDAAIQVVNDMCKLLRPVGDVFFAPRPDDGGIPMGGDWWQKLLREGAQADVYLVLVGKRWELSAENFVRRIEVPRAIEGELEGRSLIIPLCIDVPPVETDPIFDVTRFDGKSVNIWKYQGPERKYQGPAALLLDENADVSALCKTLREHIPERVKRLRDDRAERRARGLEVNGVEIVAGPSERHTSSLAPLSTWTSESACWLFGDADDEQPMLAWATESAILSHGIRVELPSKPVTVVPSDDGGSTLAVLERCIAVCDWRMPRVLGRPWPIDEEVAVHTAARVGLSLLVVASKDGAWWRWAVDATGSRSLVSSGQSSAEIVGAAACGTDFVYISADGRLHHDHGTNARLRTTGIVRFASVDAAIIGSPHRPQGKLWAAAGFDEHDQPMIGVVVAQPDGIEVRVMPLNEPAARVLISRESRTGRQGTAWVAAQQRGDVLGWPVVAIPRVEERV